MRVFMLGWEFPPFISGGLGTACFGLTKALAKQATQITFVLPKAVEGSTVSHLRLLPQGPSARHGDSPIDNDNPKMLESEFATTQPGIPGVSFRTVKSRIVSPYQSVGGQVHEASQTHTPSTSRKVSFLRSAAFVPAATVHASAAFPPGHNPMYCGDMIGEARRYAEQCVQLASRETFDVIHAHDWMTFPAGLAVAGLTGKPLVVHVHSTEFDRAGESIHQQVYDIERRGVHGAMRVVCVSHLTASIIQHRYGVDPSKIDVVYNGIDTNGHTPPTLFSRSVIRKGDKIVLFLGRITMQKGPEYFISAAEKVLAKFDKVKFVMAGSGDRITQIIELAAERNIGQKIVFTGFLSGKDVERVFRMADVYVMPSVSEPFGIAPLEAISHDVPVIISKQSGVSEVLTHALKVDFWDVEEMANKIIAVLKHPPLSSTLREQADIEVRRLTWEDAATKCRNIYQRAMQGM
ncbi:MAG: glycosyltransferase [Phycisphaera sp.]|nr:glycosyltransferase [Phycisphaera sp.]